MKHAIEEFSSIFSFGHSAFSSTEEGDLCYEISSCRDLKYDQIFDAVQMLGLKHQENFHESVMDLFKKKEILQSKKKFMSFVLSRCMKLSETPSLFSFLTVCTFIDTIVLCISDDVECFKLLKMASKCVVAAFYRRFVDVFDKENSFKGFSSYCEKLNATVLDPSGDYEENFETDSEESLDEQNSDTDSDGLDEQNSETDSEDGLDLEGFIAPDTDEVVDLLKSFSEIDDSNFLLTDCEKKLLYDRDDLTLDIDDKEDVFIPLDDKSDIGDFEILDFIMNNLLTERVNVRCLMCKDNCYKYVVLVAKELGVCEM